MADPSESLEINFRVSSALVEVVRRIMTKPRYILAKVLSVCCLLAMCKVQSTLWSDVMLFSTLAGVTRISLLLFLSTMLSEHESTDILFLCCLLSINAKCLQSFQATICIVVVIAAAHDSPPYGVSGGHIIVNCCTIMCGNILKFYLLCSKAEYFVF